MSVASARRSRVKQKAMKAQGVEIIREIRCGRLDSLDDWRKEISRLYRHMRLGKIPSQEGTRLAFVAKVAAQITHMLQELKELQSLRERLAQVQGTPLIDSTEFSTSNGQDFLPAIDDDADLHENNRTRAVADDNDIIMKEP
jgi:hypothetical protein